ncbi:hypothetical protein OROMI_025137 [Orobanche minor]
MASKQLIINNDAVVMEFIEGLVESYPSLQYLDGFPRIKVVLRTDVTSESYNKVAVISGGGSGHEPAHAGFVGEGMLTAAICGDLFASPSVDSILAGIRAVTGPKGCLLIVKNYPEDHRNFDLAATQARSEGYKIEMVIVGDDCALPPPAARRGLAGTVLVHKVAGAAAASGLSLVHVAAEAKHAAEIVGTMGASLSVCTVPGQATLYRLGAVKMQLGLGIHGDPGAAVVDVRQPADLVVSHETNYVPVKCGSNVVLMINGLGATPVMELMIAAGKAVHLLQLEHGIAVDRVYTGSFMTSRDMAGFSISIMKADEAILKRLDAVTKAPHWPVGVNGDRPPSKIRIPFPPSPLTKSDELPAVDPSSVEDPMKYAAESRNKEGKAVVVPDESLDQQGQTERVVVVVAEKFHEESLVLTEQRQTAQYGAETSTSEDSGFAKIQLGMEDIIMSKKLVLIVKDTCSESFEIANVQLESSYDFLPGLSFMIKGDQILYSVGTWLLLRKKNLLRNYNLATGEVMVLPELELREEIAAAAFMSTSDYCYVTVMWIENGVMKMWFCKDTTTWVEVPVPVPTDFNMNEAVNITGLQMIKDRGEIVTVGIFSNSLAFVVSLKGNFKLKPFLPSLGVSGIGMVVSESALIRVAEDSIFYLGFGAQDGNTLKYFYYELIPTRNMRKGKDITKLFRGKTIFIVGNTGFVSRTTTKVARVKSAGKSEVALRVYDAQGGEDGRECILNYLTAGGDLIIDKVIKKCKHSKPNEMCRCSFGWMSSDCC